MEKRKKNNIIFALVSLLVVGAVIALPTLLEKNREAPKTQAAVQSATAERTAVSTTISGTGVLVAQDAEEVTLPSGVELTRYAVKNGDVVKAGQALAYVDRTTILQAISSCKETLEHLEEEMTSAQENTAEPYVSAPARGTVKKVYAQKGDDVRQVMLEHGALAILEIDGEEWRAQAYIGTVSHVYVQEGSAVYEGSSLFYLADTNDSSTFEMLTAQHRAYEDMMQTLAILYREGVISAPCAGLVSGIDETAAAELQNAWEEKYGSASSLSGTGEAPVLEKLASHTPPTGAEEDDGLTYTGQVVVITQIAPAVRCNPQSYTVGISDFADLTGLNLSDSSFTGAETDMPYFDNRYSVVQNTWTSIRDEAYVVGQVYLNITCNETGEAFSVLIGTVQNSGGQSGPGGGQGESPGGDQPSGGRSSGSGSGGMSGDMSGFSAGGSYAAEEEEEFEAYSLDEVAYMSVTPQDTISISITVDELDVLSVREGAEAKLTIDALPGREYTGKVTALGRTASNSGGNSKYSAEITFARDETMLPGMNASSLITVRTEEDVLTLPAASLTEEGTKTLVYTAYDEKTGTLTGAREVTTGISDGENVEILSGLAEGEQVWYYYSDEITLSDLMPELPGSSGLFGGLTGSLGGFTGGGRGSGFPGDGRSGPSGRS